MTLARVAAIWHLSPARLIDRAHGKRSSAELARVPKDVIDPCLGRVESEATAVPAGMGAPCTWLRARRRAVS